MSMRRNRVQSLSTGSYIFCFIPLIHQIRFLFLSFSHSLFLSKKTTQKFRIQGQVMFVRLGSRLYKIEFANYVGAILVQCIKCEGFFFLRSLSLFFLDCVLSLILSLYLCDNLIAMLHRWESYSTQGI
jgi:hypothetical protein